MEEKQLTSRELEEQANALLAEADFEEINLPKKAKKGRSGQESERGYRAGGKARGEVSPAG